MPPWGLISPITEKVIREEAQGETSKPEEVDEPTSVGR